MIPLIRVLTASDAPAYRELRLRALRGDPAAFLTDAEEYRTRTLEAVAERLAPTPESLTLGAFVNDVLLGMATLARSASPKQHYRAEVFAVYVAPEARGLGHTLLSELIVQARAMPGLEVLGLAVTDTQLAARRLYERLGFVVWGAQPGALRLGERRLTELHMQLRL